MALHPADIATVSRLLDEALALDAAEREAWLAALPSEHQRHVQALSDMLAQEARLDTDTRLASMPKLATDDAVAHAGDRIGPYRLLHEIGRGGMGSVWLAERADGAYKRQVALKLPRLAWGAGLAERMAREREIGMLLEHRNIARLYDAGVEERGRPFLALEFVDGQPIDAWCEAQGLSVRDRLPLFLQVIKAVAYAHGRLVVHRDLKPSNVLVTPDGQAHLLDFGIAKLLLEAAPGESGLTQEQGRVLTPHYASPEQVAGEAITVQSDVYSLGVLLYELLTGMLPIAPKRRTLGAVEEAILEGDAPLASSRVKDRITARALRGEVDAILAKAMQREPGRRYPTADALALDIERHLNGETVSARPDSPLYRLRKGVRRNWMAVSAAAAVLLAVLSGSGVAVVQAQRAAQQAERARVATEFVSEVFRVSSRPGTTPGSLGSQAEPLLDQGAKLIEARFSGQPEMRAEMYGVVGRIYADIGAGPLAIDYANRRIKLLGQLPADRERMIEALLQLAEACAEDDQPDEARRYAVQAIGIAAPDSLRWAAAQALLARLELKVGNNAAAQAALLAAQGVLERDGAAKPSTAAARVLWVQAALLDDFDRALPVRQRAIEIAVQSEGPNSRSAIDFRVRLAKSLVGLNRDAESRPYMDAALSSLRESGVAGQLRAAVIATEYWSFMFEMGAATYPEALAVVERSRSLLAARQDAIPLVVRARVDQALAVAHIRGGDLREAEPLMKSSAPILKEYWRLRQDCCAHRRVVAHEGVLAMEIGQHAEADGLLRQNRFLGQQQGDGASPFAVYDWGWIAMNLMMGGDLVHAQQVLEAAPKVGAIAADPVSGSTYALVIPALLARVHLQRGDVASAVRVLPAFDRFEPESEPLYAEQALSGEVLCASGRASEGLPIILESIRTVSAKVGDKHPGLARIRAAAGLCALSLGDTTRAAKLAEQARRSFIAQPDVSPYFKVPLVKLERALGLKLPPV